MYKVGDKVVVVRRVSDYYNGWQDSWVEPMNYFIGKECIIKRIRHLGYELYCPAIGYATYNFPPESFVVPNQQLMLFDI